jgi:hypothetical protein
LTLTAANFATDPTLAAVIFINPEHRGDPMNSVDFMGILIVIVLILWLFLRA